MMELSTDDRKRRPPRMPSQNTTKTAEERGNDIFGIFDPIISTKIITPARGVSIRTGMSGRASCTNAHYASKRFGYGMLGEASTEIGANDFHEVDLGVLAAVPQPARVEVQTRSRVLRGVIDGLRYWNGRWQLFDAKRDWAGFKTKRGRQQVLLSQIAADTLNCEYVQITRDSIGSLTCYHNVTSIASYRFVEPFADEIVRLQAILACTPEIALGSLAETIAAGNRRRGRAVLAALMVRRLVAIELNDGMINDDTRVSTAPPYTPVEPLLPVAFDD